MKDFPWLKSWQYCQFLMPVLCTASVILQCTVLYVFVYICLSTVLSSAVWGLPVGCSHLLVTQSLSARCCSLNWPHLIPFLLEPRHTPTTSRAKPSATTSDQNQSRLTHRSRKPSYLFDAPASQAWYLLCSPWPSSARGIVSWARGCSPS